MPLSFTISFVVTHPQPIRSRQNERFRRWNRFANRPQDAECPWIPVRGWKQILELAHCHRPRLLLYSKTGRPELRSLKNLSQESVQISENLLKRLSGLRQDQGVIAFFDKPVWTWEDSTSCLLYIDRLQDPGNLGTLFRTAAAAEDFTIVTAPQTVSCYNEKVVRASAGYLFQVPFFQGVDLSQIEERGYQLFTTLPKGGVPLFDADLKPPLAVLIGNEGSGCETGTVHCPVTALTIPISDRVDSLNAAVSGSVVIYEIMRRRARNHE